MIIAVTKKISVKKIKKLSITEKQNWFIELSIFEINLEELFLKKKM